jgi:hypothetical protein
MRITPCEPAEYVENRLFWGKRMKRMWIKPEGEPLSFSTDARSFALTGAEGPAGVRLAGW